MELDGAVVLGQFVALVRARAQPVQMVVLDLGYLVVAAHDGMVVGGKGRQAVLLRPVPRHQHQHRGLGQSVCVFLDDPGVLGQGGDGQGCTERLSDSGVLHVAEGEGVPHRQALVDRLLPRKVYAFNVLSGTL